MGPGPHELDLSGMWRPQGRFRDGSDLMRGFWAALFIFPSGALAIDYNRRIFQSARGG
jgi:hypothetical protein